MLPSALGPGDVNLAELFDAGILYCDYGDYCKDMERQPCQKETMATCVHRCHALIPIEYWCVSSSHICVSNPFLAEFWSQKFPHDLVHRWEVKKTLTRIRRTSWRLIFFGRLRSSTMFCDLCCLCNAAQATGIPQCGGLNM